MVGCRTIESNKRLWCSASMKTACLAFINGIQCTLYSVQCTVYDLCCTQYNVRNTCYTVRYYIIYEIHLYKKYVK